MCVEFFDAWFAAELHFLTVVGFGNGVAHRIEAVTAHEANFQWVRLCVVRDGFGGRTSVHEGQKEDGLEDGCTFHGFGSCWLV
jgi:hypothetical protein